MPCEWFLVTTKDSRASVSVETSAVFRKFWALVTEGKYDEARECVEDFVDVVCMRFFEAVTRDDAVASGSRKRARSSDDAQ